MGRPGAGKAWTSFLSIGITPEWPWSSPTCRPRKTTDASGKPAAGSSRTRTETDLPLRRYDLGRATLCLRLEHIYAQIARAATLGKPNEGSTLPRNSRHAVACGKKYSPSQTHSRYTVSLSLEPFGGEFPRRTPRPNGLTSHQVSLKRAWGHTMPATV